MKLQPLTPARVPSNAASVLCTCSQCGAFKAWNDAAAAGWCADLEGTPYHNYYCEDCSRERAP